LSLWTKPWSFGTLFIGSIAHVVWDAESHRISDMLCARCVVAALASKDKRAEAQPLKT